MNTRGWVPLLYGRDADRARATSLEIVGALERQAPSSRPGLRGDASIALLLAYCGHPAAATRLETALLATASQPLTVALFGGACGASWILHELADGTEAETAIAQFDAAILRHLDVAQWAERYDLMSGLAGVGVHIANRRDVRAFQIADRVVSHLEASAIQSNTGLTWRTPPEFLPKRRRLQFPDGVIDLGVSHGVPGIIGMLAKFVNADIEVDRSRRLLEAAVAWLFDAVPRGTPRFGSSWPSDHSKSKSMGWCYGDAGIAGVLLQAGRALESARLEEEALGLLTQIVSPLAQQDVPDAGFCHGAAGLAHIYNVAFQRTANPEMRTQAVYWLGEILRFKRPGTGIAGYASWKIDDDAPRWEADTKLLSGVVGIALVLLAAIEDREPSWQQLFCL